MASRGKPKDIADCEGLILERPEYLTNRGFPGVKVCFVCRAPLANHMSTLRELRNLTISDLECVSHCQDPACKDVADMLKRGRQLGLKKQAKMATEKKGEASAADSSQSASADVGKDDDGCPMDKGELGAATWGLMHTTAAHYPDTPSKETQAHAEAFFGGLAALYPCSYCRKDFSEEIKKDPPAVASRVALSLWACRQHNLVNTKLGKDTFVCTIPRLDLRWKTGRNSCWGGTDDDREKA